MQDTFFYFHGTALIPELSSYITTGTSCYIHFVLITVTAAWAFPNQLAVIFFYFDFSIPATHLAVIAFGVKLCIKNGIVNVFDYIHNSVNVVVHIRNFNIADSSSWRKSLEAAFDSYFIEGIDWFCNMYVIRVGDITLISYSLDNTESLL